MRRLGQKRKKRNSSVLITALLAGLLFAGTDICAAVQVVSKAPRGPKDPSIAENSSESPGTGLKEEKTDEKTDPFKSFLSLQEEAEKKKKKERPRTYLETLDLSQLDLIATIIDRKGNWAMVRDAKGVGHVIRKGTRIGTNEGIVQEINEGALVIREKHTDFLGKVTVRNVVKKMTTDR